VTACDEHALDAFDAAAIDYLLKPVDTARLARTIDRLRLRLAGMATTRAPRTDVQANLQRLLGQSEHITRTVQLENGPRENGRSTTLSYLRASSGSDIRMVPVGRGAALRDGGQICDRHDAHRRIVDSHEPQGSVFAIGPGAILAGA
jgi:DNA-binding LytR/AlgR family response regulator